MNIFTAPQWDIEEASAKSSYEFDGSVPPEASKKNAKKKRQRAAKKAAKNVNGSPSPENSLKKSSSGPVKNKTAVPLFQKLLGLRSDRDQHNANDANGVDKLATKRQKRKLRMQKMKQMKKLEQQNLQGDETRSKKSNKTSTDSPSSATGDVTIPSESPLSKRQKRRRNLKWKREQSHSNDKATPSDAAGNPAMVQASLSKSAKSSGTMEVNLEDRNKGILGNSLSKIEKLLELRRKKKRARKAKKSQGNALAAKTGDDTISSEPVEVAHAPVDSETLNPKKLKFNLKRKERRKLKRESIAKKMEAVKEDKVDANMSTAGVSEVILSQRKKRRMRKAARKSQENLENAGKRQGIGSGTENPCFNESLSGSVGPDSVKRDSPLKAKRNKRKARKKSISLSDSVDGNLVSTSSGFSPKLDKSSADKQIASTVTTSDVVEEKSKKKKLVVAKLLQEAEITEKSTLHHLKSKRRSEDEASSGSFKRQKGKPLPLRERMTEQLKSARFRWLNEHLYTSESWEALKYFKEDPDAFEAYHNGYRNQVAQWPVNPVDIIIESISSLPNDTVVADFGCGDALLAEALGHLKVHSFDLVAKKPGVIACDMAHTPLLMESVNVAVFCLSLMGKNLNDFILEANRVLKMGGLLMIAEVESRFEDIDNFTSAMVHFGFQLKKKDLSNQMFIFMDFKKVRKVSKTGKLPSLTLEPCVYKKR